MKKFEFTVTQNADGNFIMESRSDGFNTPEVIGFLECKKHEILDQIRQYDKFAKREETLIKDGEQMSIEEVDAE